MNLVLSLSGTEPDNIDKLTAYVFEQSSDPNRPVHLERSFEIHDPYSPKGRDALLNSVRLLGLSKSAVTLLLPKSAYGIYSLEVSDLIEMEEGKSLDNQIRDSIHWRLAEFLPYSIEDAVVDYITLPKKNSTQKNTLLYALAARESTLRQCVTWAKDCHIKLKNIEIWPTFLCQQQINPALHRGTLYVMIEGSLLEMVIIRDAQIALIRYVELAKETLYHAETLALEVQRTIDYCTSTTGQPHIAKLIIGSQIRDPSFALQLTELIGFKVEMIGPGELLFSGENHEAAH